MTDMARTVEALESSRLPVHVTPSVETMVEQIAAEIGGESGESLRALLDPERTDEALANLGDAGTLLDPLLHNTAAPTVVRGGDKENVIPGEVTLTLDCRLLPGQDDDDLRRELRAVVPEDVDYEFEAIRYDPVPEGTDMGLFDLLADTLETADPEGTVIPYVLQGGTDGRHLARAGVQSYGFTPMRLPEDFDLFDMAHAADERIPVEALEFGTDRVHEVIRAYDAPTVAD